MVLRLNRLLSPIFMCLHTCSVASVLSDSLRPYGLQPIRFLCPCDSSGKNTGMSCHALLLICAYTLPKAASLALFLPSGCWSLRSHFWRCTFWKGLSSCGGTLRTPDLRQTLLKQMLLVSLVSMSKPYGSFFLSCCAPPQTAAPHPPSRKV